MGNTKVDKKAEAINIKAKSRKEFFLLHGYTGSPTDLNNLGNYLNKKFNANVRIIRLKGHGEVIENIDPLSYNDFYMQAERELKKDLGKGMQVVIGGISVGSILALHLASKYPVRGVLNIAPAYQYTLLAKIVSFLEPVIPKKHWVKRIHSYQKELRKNAFFYGVNLLGFRILNQGRKELDKVLSQVTSPCLFVHVSNERIFHSKGVEILKSKVSSSIKEVKLFDENGETAHNPFFSTNHKTLFDCIGDFVEKNKLFKSVS